MKRNLLKLALCAMTALPLGAWAQEPWYGTEEVVSTTTTWIFDDYSDGDLKSFSETDKLYVRANASRYFTIGSITPTLVGFSDGYKVIVSKTATGKGATGNATATGIKTANTESSSNVTYAFAFNTTVAGTCYVLMQEVAESHNTSYRRRIFWGNGTDNMTCPTYNEGKGNLGIEEISHTSNSAGVFAIGSTNSHCRIYAIRFVPTSEKKAAWAYIGSTGYASFGNTTGSHLDVPAGLTAYKAKPGTSSVTLTSLEGIPQTAGVILKGTPNTNYPLTASATTYTAENNWLVRVTADATLGQTNGSVGDDLRYNYILASDEGVAKFFKPDGTSTISKGKAYLQTQTELSAPAGARGISIIFEDDETTGITSTKVEKGDDSWYTLQGVKVTQPTKGIYVKNGKKVIIK